MTTTVHGPLYVEPDTPSTSRLEHFPVTFFAVVMGLGGLTLAWQRAASVLSAPRVVADAVFWTATVIWALITATYLAKLALRPAQVRAELHHPVRLAFVPTAAIGLLTLAAAAESRAAGLADAMWWTGMLGQLVLTLYVLTSWINRPSFELGHVSPAWFIPVVGNLVVPLDGVSQHQRELSWFFFAVGLVFWAVLMPVVFLRLFTTNKPIPARLMPTLAILMAPPSVAFLDWTRLQPGPLDPFGRVLAYTALFFLLLVLTQVRQLARLPFFLSWWAYSFPLAATTSATLVLTSLLGKPAAMTAVSWALLVSTSALVLVLVVRTSAAMARGEICVPE